MGRGISGGSLVGIKAGDLGAGPLAPDKARGSRA